MPPLRSLTAALERARLQYWEEPAVALATAIECQEQARRLGERGLESRALTLQGAVSLHLGDLRGAFALTAQAERLAGDDIPAHAEIAALNTHLHFFSGSYGESLQWAMDAVERADFTADLSLRLHARRMGCLAFGNVGVDDLRERFEEVLAMAIEAGSVWEQGVAHNDLAHLTMTEGDLASAEAHLDRAQRCAEEIAPARFLLGVVHATRSELRLTAGQPDQALAEARTAVRHVLAAARDANPYLLGMAVLSEVQALLALDRVEEARDAGERAVERLGDLVPQAGGMILSAVAAALRAAGRAEEAYDALARATELEREAMREFSQLLLGIERARLEAEGQRQEADRLRDQADRDWLTGVRNRRFLAREGQQVAGAVSLAVIDLDHFKSINDRFGHQVGDRVLVRVAELLEHHVRSEDIVIRTGGEEFAVVMPHARQPEAATACERLRAVIGVEPWGEIAPGLRLTASIGVVSTDGSEDFSALERLADERLYAAKRAGRDRVVAADESVAA